MTAAKPDHAHHCSCPKLPPDLWPRIAGAYAKYGEVFCREMLRVITGTRDHTSPAAASATHRPRFLAKVTPPDAQGHQYYMGPYPRWGAPRAMFAGRTLDIPQWLWLWNQYNSFETLTDTDHLTRTCRQPQCVSPDHHKLPAAPPPPEMNSRDLLAWEALNPKPLNPRSVNWLRGIDYQGERCQAMHPIAVYSIRPRKSYCKHCAPEWNKWHRERKAVIRAVQARESGLPARVPNQPQIPPVYPQPSEPPLVDDQPTLVDQLLAMGAWDDR